MTKQFRIRVRERNGKEEFIGPAYESKKELWDDLRKWDLGDNANVHIYESKDELDEQLDNLSNFHHDEVVKRIKQKCDGLEYPIVELSGDWSPHLNHYVSKNDGGAESAIHVHIWQALFGDYQSAEIVEVKGTGHE